MLNALQAASWCGYRKVLFNAEAEVNAQGGGYGNAQQAGPEGGHEISVQLLLAIGAEGYQGSTEGSVVVLDARRRP